MLNGRSDMQVDQEEALEPVAPWLRKPVGADEPASGHISNRRADRRVIAPAPSRSGQMTSGGPTSRRSTSTECRTAARRSVHARSQRKLSHAPAATFTSTPGNPKLSNTAVSASAEKLRTRSAA